MEWEQVTVNEVLNVEMDELVKSVHNDMELQAKPYAQEFEISVTVLLIGGKWITGHDGKALHQSYTTRGNKKVIGGEEQLRSRLL